MDIINGDNDNNTDEGAHLENQKDASTLETALSGTKCACSVKGACGNRKGDMCVKLSATLQELLDEKTTC